MLLVRAKLQFEVLEGKCVAVAHAATSVCWTCSAGQVDSQVGGHQVSCGNVCGFCNK